MASRDNATRGRTSARVLLPVWALITICLGVAGCDSCGKDDVRKPGVTAPPRAGGVPRSLAAPVPAEDAVRNEQRIRAMTSIHAHARWPRDRFPDGFEPQGLPEAAQFLAQDDGVLAKSRRRRAIAKLFAYGRGRPDVEDALRILGADPAVIASELEIFQLKCTDKIIRIEQVETAVYGQLAFTALTVPGCPAQELEVFSPESGAPEAFSYTRISIDKDVTDVARSLDPQSWDVCSKFFKVTYLAKLDSNGKPIVDPLTVDPGNPYGGVLGERTLFEHYECLITGASGCDSWFENMLFASTWWDPTSVGSRKFNVRYSLTPGGWLDGEVAKSKAGAEITTDNGGTEVQETTSGPAQAAGWKTIKFDNPVVTGATKAIFTVMADEIAGEFAELACCPIPRSVTATPTPVP